MHMHTCEGDHDAAQSQLLRAMLAAVARGGGAAVSASTVAAAILADHASAWATTWGTDVTFDAKAGLTGPALVAAAAEQASLRYAMYNFHSSVRPGSVVDLHGTLATRVGDALLLPAMVFLCPAAVRTVLDTQRARLPQARAAAQVSGLEGALFVDTSDAVAGDAGTARWRATASLDICASAMLSVHAWSYFRATLDRAWLQDAGYSLLSDIADMLCSAARPASPGSAFYTLGSTVGLDDSVICTDNALTVSCTLQALVGALQASYELQVSPRTTWVTVAAGLTVPVSARGVVQFAAGAPSTASPVILEPLLLLAPYLSQPLLQAGLDLQTALPATYQYWASNASPAAVGHPLNHALRGTALAQMAQWDMTGAAVTGMTAEFDAVSSAGPSADTAFGNVVAANPSDAANDLGMTAAQLMVVLQGMVGARVTGGISDTRYCYEPFGMSLNTAAVLPAAWAQVRLSGIGAGKRSCVTLNRTAASSSGYVGTALPTQVLAPWSVKTLLTPSPCVHTGCHAVPGLAVPAAAPQSGRLVVGLQS
jgi:hypothetical protein